MPVDMPRLFNDVLQDRGLMMRAGARTLISCRALPAHRAIKSLATPGRRPRQIFVGHARIYTRSTTTAIPWPTPMHIVQSA